MPVRITVDDPVHHARGRQFIHALRMMVSLNVDEPGRPGDTSLMAHALVVTAGYLVRDSLKDEPENGLAIEWLQQQLAEAACPK